MFSLYYDIEFESAIANTAKLIGTTPEKALQRAYDKIKDRKGRMVGGKWVKQEDLEPEVA